MSGNGNGGPGSALRRRAAVSAGREVERVPEGPVLRDQVQSLEREFAKALPTGEAVQYVRDALTCLRTIDKLDRCEPQSVLGALMTCAQLGLRPGVLGHAWPLPFWDGRNRRFAAQLVIGYQGYIHLGYQSERVASIRASVIREEDTWEWDEGSDDPPVHRRPKLGTDRGPVVGFYSRVATTTGGLLVFLMDAEEMRQWRDRHAPRGKPRAEGEPGPIVGPWGKPEDSDDYIGMALKTTIRRVAKHMPKSAQFAAADRVDGTVRVDVSALSEPEVVSDDPTRTPAEGIVLPGPERDPVLAADPTTDPGWGAS